jgi:hypothetical protein
LLVRGGFISIRVRSEEEDWEDDEHEYWGKIQNTEDLCGILLHDFGNGVSFCATDERVTTTLPMLPLLLLLLLLVVVILQRLFKFMSMLSPSDSESGHNFLIVQRDSVITANIRDFTMVG